MTVGRITPMICIMGVIFVLSHIPGNAFIQVDIVNLDKVVHMVCYGVLALSVIWGWYPPGCKRSPLKTALAVILFCILYGISDEYHQSFIPGREPSLYDVIADGLGAVLVSFAWLWWGKRT